MNNDTTLSAQAGESKLLFTDQAARKVYELIQEEKDGLGLNLRVFITGGGCSGFQYGFNFDRTVRTDDTVVEKRVSKHGAGDSNMLNDNVLNSNEDDDSDKSGDDDEGGDTGVVRLVIDALSIQYLTGAEIDYREDLQGARFVIRNPNAKTTCGCGSSFSV